MRCIRPCVASCRAFPTISNGNKVVVFKAPEIARSEALPALSRIQLACFINTVGIGAALHACSTFLQPNYMALTGVAMLLLNFHHQQHQVRNLNKLLGRHVRCLILAGPDELQIECDQIQGPFDRAVYSLTRVLEIEPEFASIEEKATSLHFATFSTLVTKRIYHIDTLNGHVMCPVTLNALWPRVILKEHRHLPEGSVYISMENLFAQMPKQHLPKFGLGVIGRESVQFCIAWSVLAGSSLGISWWYSLSKEDVDRIKSDAQSIPQKDIEMWSDRIQWLRSRFQ